MIATDKKLGLNVYDLQGKRLQVVPDGRMNNVDLREGFMLAGKSTTIVAATNRTTSSISVYRFDAATRRLESIAAGTLESGMSDPYGLCMYRSAKSGQYYVIANDSVDGKYRQWRVLDRGGKAAIELVREIAVGSQAEGCAADDELGQLYIAEEDVGRGCTRLSRTAASSARPSTRRRRQSERGRGGRFDLLRRERQGLRHCSNQGEDNYAVYRREAPHAFVGKFHVVANETLASTAHPRPTAGRVSAPLGRDYPAGCWWYRRPQPDAGATPELQVRVDAGCAGGVEVTRRRKSGQEEGRVDRIDRMNRMNRMSDSVRVPASHILSALFILSKIFKSVPEQSSCHGRQV